MAVKVKQHKGKWWLFIDYKGKRKAKKVGSEKAAYDAAAKIEAKLTLGDFKILEPEKAPVPSFGAYAKGWLETCEARELKASTLVQYRGVIAKYLTPVWDRRLLTAIPRDEMRRLVVALAHDGLGRARVGLILSVITAIFTQAADDEIIPRNPAARLGRYVGKKKSRDLPRLTATELPLFLQEAQQSTPEWYPFFLLLARAGLRLGEGLGLKWSDIDWHGGFIDVQRTFSCGRVTTPKSGKSRRVDMSPQLAATLRVWQQQQQERAWHRQWAAVPEWVFYANDQQPFSENTPRRHLEEVLSKTGLRRITIHGLRHTFASLLIEKGESLVYIKDQLGHHSIKVTVDTYGHLIPGGNRAAVAKLDDPIPPTIRNPDATSQTTEAGGPVVHTDPSQKIL